MQNVAQNTPYRNSTIRHRLRRHLHCRRLLRSSSLLKYIVFTIILDVISVVVFTVRHLLVIFWSDTQPWNKPQTHSLQWKSARWTGISSQSTHSPRMICNWCV